MNIPMQSQIVDGLAVIGAGYIVHKIYAAVEYGTAKVKAVAAALRAPAAPSTPPAAAKTTTAAK